MQVSNMDEIFFKNDYLDANGAFSKFSQHESKQSKQKPELDDDEEIEINYFKFEHEGLSKSQQ